MAASLFLLLFLASIFYSRNQNLPGHRDFIGLSFIIADLDKNKANALTKVHHHRWINWLRCPVAAQAHEEL